MLYINLKQRFLQKEYQQIFFELDLEFLVVVPAFCFIENINCYKIRLLICIVTTLFILLKHNQFHGLQQTNKCIVSKSN